MTPAVRLKGANMKTASEAYEASVASKAAQRALNEFEEQIDFAIRNGQTHTCLVVDYNPQAALHHMRDLGYIITVEPVKNAYGCYNINIAWHKI